MMHRHRAIRRIKEIRKILEIMIKEIRKILEIMIKEIRKILEIMIKEIRKILEINQIIKKIKRNRKNINIRTENHMICIRKLPTGKIHMLKIHMTTQTIHKENHNNPN